MRGFFNSPLRDITSRSACDPLLVYPPKNFWDRYGAIEGAQEAVRFSLVGSVGQGRAGLLLGVAGPKVARRQVNSYARVMNLMRGHDVAWEGGTVHHQHPVAFAREQHSGRRTRAACTNNHGIIHDVVLRYLLLALLPPFAKFRESPEFPKISANFFSNTAIDLHGVDRPPGKLGVPPSMFSRKRISPRHHVRIKPSPRASDPRRCLLANSTNRGPCLTRVTLTALRKAA